MMNNKYNIYIKDLNIYKYYRISSTYFIEMRNLTRPDSLPPIVTQQNNNVINDENMNISFFNYFYTFSIGLMCYSFLNPSFIYDTSILMAYSFAKMMVNGYYLYTSYVHRPYIKYIHNPLMNILNIDNGIYEIVIVKNGNIIYQYKTMSDFIKNNTIKFIHDDSDTLDNSDDNDDDAQLSETKEESTETTLESQPQYETKTQVDADLTYQNVNIHKSKTEDKDTDTTFDSNKSTNDYNFILDPKKYDFVLRNIYFKNENLNIPFGFCLKYETFRKSDTKEKYTHDILNSMLSKRRFIGINLKTEDKEYLININSPINYYIVDNTILDYSFLKMYLFNRYNVMLGYTYKLSCIDNFIEMYTIEQGKKFLVKKNSFKIIDDETYKVNSDENEDENEDEDEDENEDENENENDDEDEDENKSGSGSKFLQNGDDIDIEFVDYNFKTNIET